MIVKIKKLNENAVVPFYSKFGDAGMDLVATSKEDTEKYIEFGIGWAIEIPLGYVGLIFPRSSISNYYLDLANAVGVIDSGYRQEIKVRFRKLIGHDEATIYKIGDKVAQLIILPYPQIVLEVSDELSLTNRTGGFGSTG